MIRIFTDGGSRGNPGPAALGVWISDEKGQTLARIGKRIGIDTNNVAEYRAVIEALSWLQENNIAQSETISFFLDSTLVCSQINGTFKVKNENMKKLLAIVLEKKNALGLQFSFSYIPREKNKEADLLVNQALDNII